MKSSASPTSFCTSVLQRGLHFLFLPVTCVLLSVLSLPAHAQSASSPIVMKMADYMDSMVDRGVETMNSFKARVSNELAPAAPTAPAVTRLKMDKINSRFVEKQDVVYDRMHNLTWSRCSLGQRWVSNKGCTGTVRQFTFDQAQQRANEQWRLPTAKELATLIDRSRKNMPEELTIDSVAFPDMDVDKLYYWSSDEENNSFAWAVLFIDSGIPSILYRSHRYAVRLVHSGI